MLHVDSSMYLSLFLSMPFPKDYCIPMRIVLHGRLHPQEKLHPRLLAGSAGSLMETTWSDLRALQSGRRGTTIRMNEKLWPCSGSAWAVATRNCLISYLLIHSSMRVRWPI